MSEILCYAAWTGRDNKPHVCEKPQGHGDKCHCSCGESGRVVNKLASWEPKPYYKRRKNTGGTHE